MKKLILDLTLPLTKTVHFADDYCMNKIEQTFQYPTYQHFLNFVIMGKTTSISKDTEVITASQFGAEKSQKFIQYI